MTGAEVLSIDAEGGSCNATTVVPLYLQDPRLLKLVSTATTKLDLVCGFKNATAVPKSLTFTGHTNASGECTRADGGWGVSARGWAAMMPQGRHAGRRNPWAE